ncbi:MAG: hypothetical protein JO110_15505 [Acetobacteraceae bacterium]|nr:hypothetical protein [Acetobacteraceae bacterium]
MSCESQASEAYSHEVSSAGFWPGNAAFPQTAFYSYAYPEPAGFRDRPVTPGVRFDKALGEFILLYDTVRSAAEPEALLLEFLSTTYAAAAETGGWDRAALECPIGASASGLAVVAYHHSYGSQVSLRGLRTAEIGASPPPLP